MHNSVYGKKINIIFTILKLNIVHLRKDPQHAGTYILRLSMQAIIVCADVLSVVAHIQQQYSIRSICCIYAACVSNVDAFDVALHLNMRIFNDSVEKCTTEMLLLVH